ncbi:MAG: cation-transporting P-type ATPase [bacterium]
MGGVKTDTLDSYRLSTADSLVQYQSKIDGLTDSEVQLRQEKFGANKLYSSKSDNLAIRFIRQFKDLMLLLLLLSAAFSFAINDKRTCIILLAIVFINALIGFSQEYKAEKVMESLEKLIVPLAKVKRGGKLGELPSEMLIPGDIIYIEEGDSVPADARVIEENELSTNDFALTGESNPSRKFQHAIEAPVPLSDRHNLVYMGTTVATGDATCLVIATGANTELGRIASLSSGTKSDPSPLQKEMTILATTITKYTLGLSAILAAIAWQADFGLRDSFIFAIGISSAMIPQGLPAEVNTALASAAGRLAKDRALVKKLSAVETLGATSVILTDKTGTLTKNEMTVQQLIIGKTVYNVSGIGYENNGKINSDKNIALNNTELQNLKDFFVTGAFASNAKIHEPDDTHDTWYCLGDPTEGALITLAKKSGIIIEQIEKSHKELREHPFDSARKRMSSIRFYDGNLTAFMKGAPEQILKVCTHYWDGKSVRKLTVHDIQDITARNDLWASAAMRNLAFAKRIFPEDTKLENLDLETTEKNMIFMGLVSMIDPPREEVPEAMKAARAANIPVSIITGDNALTARAIAVRAGLAANPSELKLIEGDNLPNMSDQSVLALIANGQAIFSRVAPEDKLRIVEIAKKAGLIVAVTGDGINDAPALKRADIGVAMGKTGTDVAKQSADIILLDDSFNTLVNAVQTGRVIFQNIRKAALSAITSNGGELFVVLISLIAKTKFGIPIAIGAVQILAIDLIAELFPIAALGWDPAEGDLMHENPRNLNDHILNKSNLWDLAWSGALMGSFGYLNYILYFVRNDLSPAHFSKATVAYATATTLTYTTICLCQFGSIFIRRIKPGHKLLTSYLWSNKKLFIAFGISITLMMSLIYLPFIQPYFGTYNLALGDWFYAILAAVLFVTIRQGVFRLKKQS